MTPLEQVADALRCPVCREPVRVLPGVVRCVQGHSFDLARQGYVSLLGGRRTAGTADTAAMVLARERFLGAGHLDAVTEGLVAVVGASAGVPGLVLDVAGGTGHHLATVLEAQPRATGLCLDLSTPALRRAARGHPRMAAVAADAWGRLPLADGCVAVALSLFGPRNAAELRRVLAPGGAVVVVAPAGEHLAELVEPLGLLRVDPDKATRQAAVFAEFDVAEVQTVTERRILGRDEAGAAVRMGPTAAHVTDEEIDSRVAGLAEATPVTVAVTVTRYVPR